MVFPVLPPPANFCGLRLCSIPSNDPRGEHAVSMFVARCHKSVWSVSAQVLRRASVQAETSSPPAAAFWLNKIQRSL